MGLTLPRRLFKNAPGVFVGAARLLRARSVQLAAPGRGFVQLGGIAPVVRTPVGGCSKTLPAFLSGQPAYCVRGLSNWLRQLSNPGRGFSSPPVENIKEKSPYFRTGSHLEYGGEGGIRTPDTLPYTHFPGVLLQPLGHLTILSFPLLSGTGANVGKYVSPVNQLFAKKARLDKLRATCSLNVRNPFFLSPVAFPFSLGGNLLCWQTNRKQ